MIKQEMEPGEIELRVHDLAKAMSKIRSAQADRDDVVVEIKDTKLSRLELLFEDLQPVINDIPKDNEQFDFALSNGITPRLWIDMTSFVRMGADGREYEFVKDTRMGRVILGRGSNRKKIGDHVTSYIAERVLERERMIEGDWLSLTHMMNAYQGKSDEEGFTQAILDDEENGEANASELRDDVTDANQTQPNIVQPQYSTLSLFVWFLLGLAGGAAILFILVWFGLVDEVVQMVR